MGRKEDSAAAWRVAQDLYRPWGDEEQVTLAQYWLDKLANTPTAQP
ncbi:hypothetical protein [Prochlorothrix hollandica]